MSAEAGIRYLRFALGFRRQRRVDIGNSLLVGALFSLTLGVFGVMLAVMLIAIAP